MGEILTDGPRTGPQKDKPRESHGLQMAPIESAAGLVVAQLIFAAHLSLADGQFGLLDQQMRFYHDLYLVIVASHFAIRDRGWLLAPI